MSEFNLCDGSASIEGELSLLSEKEYTMPMSKKDITESLKTALYELLTYADTVKRQNESIVKLAKNRVEQNKAYEDEITSLREVVEAFDNWWAIISAIKYINNRGVELYIKLKEALAKHEKGGV